MDKPNILLFLTDQQRVDTLGFRGRTPCQTPNMDRLATEGISFDRCLTPNPICVPARASIFTGLYSHQTNMMSNDNTLECDPALLTLLGEQGYQLDYAGKWHMGNGNINKWLDRWAGEDTGVYSQWCLEQGLPDGWAFNDPNMRTHRTPSMSIPVTAVSPHKPEQTNDGWVADHAIRLLTSRKKSQPFLLTCSFNGPHPPFKIPEPFYSMYDPKNIPEPPNFTPGPEEPQCNRTSFFRKLWRDHGDHWEAWKKSVAVYWGFVTLIDQQIGRVLKSLESEGVLDQTLIIFTSDHGEMLGQHGLWHKYHAYEEALRVPLVMRAPWLIKSGIRSQAGASLIDIAPTVLSTCGIDCPGNLQGIDLSTAFAGNESWMRDRVLFSEHQPHGDWHRVVDWRMATDNHYKYVWNRGDRDELYDILSDPYENVNLVDDPAAEDVLNHLRGKLDSWMQRTSDPLHYAF